jgi:hypothetical protein
MANVAEITVTAGGILDVLFLTCYEKVWLELQYSLNVCRATPGTHVIVLIRTIT